MTGDFNADFNRSNRFDVILKKITKESNYVIKDNLNPINPPTFSVLRFTITANIDHFIFCQNSFPPFFKNPYFSIFDNPDNFSFQIDLRDVNLSIKPSIPIKKLISRMNKFVIIFSTKLSQN